jgi:phage tail-like protein
MSTFSVEFDGITISQLTQVSGLKTDRDVIVVEDHTADGKVVIKKVFGPSRGGELTLIHKVTDQNSFFEGWIKLVDSDSAQARKDGTITIFDSNGRPLHRYNLINAWPKSREISTLKDGDTGTPTETVVVTYEAMNVM